MEEARPMSASTTKALSLAIVAAAWAAMGVGAVVFGMVYQARFLPLLSYTAGAIVGAGTYLAMGFHTFAMNGAIRVGIALAIGCVLGIAAERVAEMLGKMRVVPAMSNRS